MTVELKNVTVDLPIYSSNAQSLRRSLTKLTVGGALFRRADKNVSVRALDSVSLRLEDGQRLGLVGPNGAGKTTLLKVLAGVYTPSAGQVSVRGSISSALNISLGLDVQGTGRENVYLLAYYRGLSRRTVDSQIDDIIEAAELGPFIDLPVNTYSSGMMGRLMFAVATAFEPDVLLMDEWLLAGDAQFMVSASARVDQFVERARIMVLASHNNDILKAFCSHGLYLRGGAAVAFGPIDEIVDRYAADAAA